MRLRHGCSRWPHRAPPLAAGELSAVLGELARTLVADYSVQDILDHLADRIVTALPVTAAGIALVLPPTPPYYLAASSGADRPTDIRRLDLSEGPGMLAYETGRTLMVPDLSGEDRFPRFAAAALAAGFAATFAFPFGDSAGRLGSVDLYRDSAGPLDASDMMAARTLADVAVAYIVIAGARNAARERLIASKRARCTTA